MNLQIPVPKQAHVVHVIDGLDLVHQSWEHLSLIVVVGFGCVCWANAKNNA